MSDLFRRLNKLEEQAHIGPVDESGREEERKRIREQAEHANFCGWGEELGRWPLFEIDEGGSVFCTHDGRPVTDSRQIVAELFYWMEVEWDGPGLVHDEEAQAFYTPSGHLALSRDCSDLQHLMGPARDYAWRAGGGIADG
jgi:hypothetical protein